MTLQSIRSNRSNPPPPRGGGAAKPIFSHFPEKPAKPVPPGHEKKSKTVPSPAPQQKGHGRKHAHETGGMEGHGGAFPALPPKGRG
jgi:hypothetical protein